MIGQGNKKMNKKELGFAVMASLALAIVPYTPLATADDTVCIDTLAPGTYDNVVISSGSCSLNSTHVITGNVLQTDGDLFIDGTSIAGNVQSEGGGATVIDSSTIRGNLQIDKKSSGFIFIVGNRVDGNIQDNKNITEFNIILDNIIKGNLECKDNDVAPITAPQICS